MKTPKIVPSKSPRKLLHRRYEPQRKNGWELGLGVEKGTLGSPPTRADDLNFYFEQKAGLAAAYLMRYSVRVDFATFRCLAQREATGGGRDTHFPTSIFQFASFGDVFGARRRLLFGAEHYSMRAAAFSRSSLLYVLAGR